MISITAIVLAIIFTYLIGLGILIEHELAWYYAIPLFILSPVFVPVYIGIKISQI